MKKKHTFIDYIIILCLILLGFVAIYPFINTLAIAFNDGTDSLRGGIYFLPRKWTLENFQTVLARKAVHTGFKITTLRTVIGTVASTICIGILAYAMSKKNLMFRKFYTFYFLITMYVTGLIIPTFLLFRALNLINNFLVFVLPYLVNVFYMIMMMTFFRSIPDAIEESAKIDGAGDFRIFISLIIPLSKPIIAVIALYNAVFQWNAWFDAFIFITVEELVPLQNALIKVINSTIANELSEIADAMQRSEINVTIKSIRAATMIVTIGPIIFAYPFAQKYFIKGVMIGSVKG